VPGNADHGISPARGNARKRTKVRATDPQGPLFRRFVAPVFSPAPCCRKRCGHHHLFPKKMFYEYRVGACQNCKLLGATDMFKGCIVVLVLFTSTHTYPVGASDNSLRGKFTFNWHADPAKTRCVRIDDKLLSIFHSHLFHCDLNAIDNTASGVPASVCSKADGSSEYMIFSTFASCENERKIQAANGE
jgi:hypothetical protein